MYKLLAFTLNFLIIISLSNCSQNYNQAFSESELNNVLDSILPKIAKLHDSIPDTSRLNPALKEFYEIHKKERQYEINQLVKKDGVYYFLISRLEPSVKKDKYSSVCGSFTKDIKNQISYKNYNEYFWTWKMKKEELLPKAEMLLKNVINNVSLEKYLPQNAGDQYIMFPDENVSWNSTSQKWESK